MTASRRLLPVLFLEAANLTSGLGNAVVMLAFPWLVLQETGSAAAAGAVAAISALPALLAAPLTGWLVDRLGRKPVAIGADVVSALSVAAVPIVDNAASSFGIPFTRPRPMACEPPFSRCAMCRPMSSIFTITPTTP